MFKVTVGDWQSWRRDLGLWVLVFEFLIIIFYILGEDRNIFILQK